MTPKKNQLIAVRHVDTQTGLSDWSKARVAEFKDGKVKLIRNGKPEWIDWNGHHAVTFYGAEM